MGGKKYLDIKTYKHSQVNITYVLQSTTVLLIIVKGKKMIWNEYI
jgi:hypothetical protein